VIPFESFLERGIDIFSFRHWKRVAIVAFFVCVGEKCAFPFLDAIRVNFSYFLISDGLYRL
jgi:hypothetical protein